MNRRATSCRSWLPSLSPCIPMKLLIAASNELPAQGDGLEALWDRFIIRLECRGIKKEANFDMMLLDDSCDCPEMPSEELQISDEEYSL